MKNEMWPELSFADGNATYETIHLWTQIAGKIKLARQPEINHSWNVALSVVPFGLTTGNIAFEEKYFQIDFDFTEHQLQIITSAGERKSFNLENISVAQFYKKIMSLLSELSISININIIPNEIENAIPFNSDETHRTYVPLEAIKLHKALLNANEVFTQFRSEFIGKSSPVHFFWGGFDLAVSRFSGREAPKHPGGIPNMPDRVAIEAYSHEVCSCGFWPGNEANPFAAFYSYIYPEPPGYKNISINPEAAFYHKELGEYMLYYKDLQQSSEPVRTLLEFLHSTYEGAAELANWDRKRLEKA